jgi:hypothetical protein
MHARIENELARQGFVVVAEDRGVVACIGSSPSIDAGFPLRVGPSTESSGGSDRGQTTYLKGIKGFPTRNRAVGFVSDIRRLSAQAIIILAVAGFLTAQGHEDRSMPARVPWNGTRKGRRLARKRRVDSGLSHLGGCHVYDVANRSCDRRVGFVSLLFADIWHFSCCVERPGSIRRCTKPPHPRVLEVSYNVHATEALLLLCLFASRCRSWSCVSEIGSDAAICKTLRAVSR